MKWPAKVPKKYAFLMGKPEVKRPLGRPRRKWQDNVKTNREVIG